MPIIQSQLKIAAVNYPEQVSADEDLIDEYEYEIDEVEETDEDNSSGGKSHKELVRSEKRLRSLIELAPDGIITMNLRGFVTSANRAYYQITGYTEEEIIGRHFVKLDIIRFDEVPKYLKLLGSIVRGRVPKTFEFEYKTKSGETRWGEAHVKLVNIGLLQREIITVLRDVTERREMERRQEELLKDLERSNQDLDDFTYAVSHDLKAPLRTIESFSEFLLEDYCDSLDETGREYLQRMRDSARRMKELTDDLLQLSRVGRKHVEEEEVDLNSVLGNIKLDFEGQVRERPFRVVVGEMPVIRTQKVWLQQIFINLIGNGLKFNESQEPTVWVGHEDGGDHHHFSVRDNGIGIDPKYHDRIFKIFERLHGQDEYPGTGAGLTICRKIVDLWRGRIWLESEPGKGTTFHFTIPKESKVDGWAPRAGESPDQHVEAEERHSSA